VRILAIETSGPIGGVAILESERLLAERIFERGMVHGRELAPSIARLSEDTGVSLQALDLVAVDIGPGSFTGLRVGLAAAKGLCLALSKPILGVVSLDAMAESARGRGSILCPVLGAKWDQVYGALYAPNRISEIHAEPPEEFVKGIPPEAVVFGDALEKHGDLFGNRPRLGREFAHPQPSVLGRLAAREFMAGRRDDVRTLVPLYPRPTEAELKAATRRP